MLLLGVHDFGETTPRAIPFLSSLVYSSLLIELEETFRGHLVQPPCSEQGHLQLDQIAQSPVQPGLECLQGSGLHCLSGQSVPVFYHPHGKKFLPSIQSKSTLS